MDYFKNNCTRLLTLCPLELQ